MLRLRFSDDPSTEFIIDAEPPDGGSDVIFINVAEAPQDLTSLDFLNRVNKRIDAKLHKSSQDKMATKAIADYLRRNPKPYCVSDK